MLEITISTPALVFPALSVLMLAYTNRFIAISRRVRALHAEYKNTADPLLISQIKSLRKRLVLIRNTQTTAIIGFLINMLCIGLILLGTNILATILFGISLLFIMTSLVICVIEIHQSVQAMSIQLAEDLNL